MLYLKGGSTVEFLKLCSNQMKCCEVVMIWEKPSSTEPKYGYSHCKHPYLGQDIQE